MSAMNTANLTAMLDRLRAEPRESEWLEFKACYGSWLKRV